MRKSAALLKYRSQLCEKVGLLARELAEVEDEIEAIDRGLALIANHELTIGSEKEL
ncbi:hypothetical protein UFOVP28_61 [uncultured Caudovirales phage]|uniref:Uncharacterized protein n=1 Tax=uncultured Caudovirales phage TaxID=2100421 RepID=A0A6J5KPP4_9CAUD|nr:hypothetical protein UFOVP28_61 [uncultured Caudovirales phage]